MLQELSRSKNIPYSDSRPALGALTIRTNYSKLVMKFQKALYDRLKLHWDPGQMRY